MEIEDIERAIKLVTKSMRQVGYDPESGEFDADIIETGLSENQRERRERIVTVIERLDGATVGEIDDKVKFEEEILQYDVEQLKEAGRIYAVNDEFRRT